MAMQRNRHTPIRHLLRPENPPLHPAIDTDTRARDMPRGTMTRQKGHRPPHVLGFPDLGHRHRRLGLDPALVRIIQASVIHRGVDPPGRDGVDPRATVQADDLVLDGLHEAVLQARFAAGVFAVARLAVHPRLGTRDHDGQVGDLFVVVAVLPVLRGREEVFDRQEGAADVDVVPFLPYLQGQFPDRPGVRFIAHAGVCDQDVDGTGKVRSRRGHGLLHAGLVGHVALDGEELVRGPVGLRGDGPEVEACDAAAIFLKRNCQPELLLSLLLLLDSPINVVTAALPIPPAAPYTHGS